MGARQSFLAWSAELAEHIDVVDVDAAFCCATHCLSKVGTETCSTRRTSWNIGRYLAASGAIGSSTVYAEVS